MINNNASDQPFFNISEISSGCREMVEQEVQPHVHDYFSIYWIDTGEAVHATRYVQHSIKASSLLFVTKELVHWLIVETGCTGISIHFNTIFQDRYLPNIIKGLIADLFNSPDYKTIISLDNHLSIKFGDLVSRMKEESGNEQHFKDEILASLLTIFLLEAKRIKDETTGFESVGEYNISERQYIQFNKLIDEHYMVNKEVFFYANLMNIRVAQLNEITKRNSGITAGELIREKVMSEAKKQLYGTTKTTKEIAYDLGFNDPAYFSRFFKKYANMTLLSFRTIIRNKVQ